MNLDLYYKLQEAHIEQHSKGQTTLSTDYTCLSCHPIPEDIPGSFRNFWNWISAEFGAIIFTGKTIFLFDQLSEKLATLIFLEQLQLDTTTAEYRKPVQIRVEKLLYSLTFINPKVLGPNSGLITSSVIKAAKESNFFKEPVITQFDSIVPLVISPTLTPIDIMTGEENKNKNNNQHSGLKPPNQGHRSGLQDEWGNDDESYGFKNNEALNNNSIAAIIKQMSDSFKGIAKEIRDARPQAFPRETNIIPVQPFWRNDSEDPEEWFKHLKRLQQLIIGHLKGKRVLLQS